MTCIAVMFSNFGILIGAFVFIGSIIGIICGYLLGRRDGRHFGFEDGRASERSRLMPMLPTGVQSALADGHDVWIERGVIYVDDNGKRRNV